MTSYSFNPSLPASFPASVKQRTRVKTNLSWCPSFPCHTAARAKKPCMGQSFCQQKWYFFYLSLSSDSYWICKHCLVFEETIYPSESVCRQSSLIHPKHKLGMQSVHLLLQGQIKTEHKSDRSLFFSSLGSGSIFPFRFLYRCSIKSFKAWIKPPTSDESHQIHFFRNKFKIWEKK